MVEWAKSRKDNLEVQDLIERFGETQSETGRVVAMSIVRSLLKKNGATLPSMSSARQVLKNFHRGFTREELQSLLGFLNFDYLKLYVMIAKDSGFRSQDILSLRYHHFKKDLEAGETYVHIYLEPSYYNRKKASGRTFIGPNTVQLLKQHLEKLDLSKDPKIFSQGYSSMAESMRLARTKAHIDPLVQPTHGFRKFFEGALDRVGMDVHKKLQLEGHSLGVRIHYTDRELSELRLLYQKAYQYLDLSEEAATDNRFKDLEKALAEKTQHIEALKAEIAKSKERDSEIEEIRKELRRQREQLEKRAKE